MTRNGTPKHKCCIFLEKNQDTFLQYFFAIKDGVKAESNEPTSLEVSFVVQQVLFDVHLLVDCLLPTTLKKDLLFFITADILHWLQ